MRTHLFVCCLQCMLVVGCASQPVDTEKIEYPQASLCVDPGNPQQPVECAPQDDMQGGGTAMNPIAAELLRSIFEVFLQVILNTPYSYHSGYHVQRKWK